MSLAKASSIHTDSDVDVVQLHKKTWQLNYGSYNALKSTIFFKCYACGINIYKIIIVVWSHATCLPKYTFKIALFSILEHSALLNMI